MNKDTWIGILGSLVLISAMVGVFVYERASAQAASDAPGDETTAGIAGPTLTDTVAIGETETSLANVTATSARNVTFTLAWTATSGRDTLKLTVAPPTGSGIPEGGASDGEDDGEIVVPVLVPEGASPQGQWEVKVEFVRAEPDLLPGGVPPPSPVPSETDSSVKYTIQTTLS